MPIIEQLFDDQIRFRLKSEQKRKLFAEAARQHKAAADLLREFCDSLPAAAPEPARRPRARRGTGKARAVKAA